ncbi:MAG: PAS domain S-box protein [Nitrospinota bacterium]|nr:MAG: PAS domain S-box protein [Nitrospinota bacterium]
MSRAEQPQQTVSHHFFSPETTPSPERLQKRKQRNRWIIAIAFCLVILLTLLENYLQSLSVSSPVANNIAVFTMVNINIILLIVVVFLVMRNLVKLYFERKGKIIGSKFRTKLVIAFVGFSLIPSVLLFFIASGLLTGSIGNWFNSRVEQSLEESLAVAQSYYRNTEERVLQMGRHLAQSFPQEELFRSRSTLQRLVHQKRQEFMLDGIAVFSPTLEVIASSLQPRLQSQAFAPALFPLIERALAGEEFTDIRAMGKGEIIRGIVPVRHPQTREVLGVVVVSHLVPQSLVSKMNIISKVFEEYRQLKILRNPIKIGYIITFLTTTLLIVFSATWFGIYLAKGITTPIQRLAEGTKAVAEGHLDFHLQVESDDELGMLVSSFNQMTADLKASKQELERVNAGLKQTNRELERRRSYMEAILENIATGVISIDQHGRVSTINKSAEIILGLQADQVRGLSYRRVFEPSHLNTIRALVKKMSEGKRERIEEQVQVLVGGRILTLMVNITLLHDCHHQYLGMVLVFDDLTELIKAQKLAAWREVAQGIAHEIKNPLTPIRLSAQRMRKKYLEGAPDFPSIFEECTQTIISQVEALKALVDEFSHFARMPEPHPTPNNLHHLLEEVVALYRGSHKSLEIVCQFDPKVPSLEVDRDQIKRVFINLLENAVEAMGGVGRIEIKTRRDFSCHRVRIEVNDTGPGIPVAHKEKLFLPYFSTKKGGTGLGLAIVNRIIADHNGTIRVQDHHPYGTSFVIELPIP